MKTVYDLDVILNEWNEERSRNGDEPLDFGIALAIGDVEGIGKPTDVVVLLEGSSD
jgi:hypothetical protein